MLSILTPTQELKEVNEVWDITQIPSVWAT